METERVSSRIDRCFWDPTDDYPSRMLCEIIHGMLRPVLPMFFEIREVMVSTVGTRLPRALVEL